MENYSVDNDKIHTHPAVQIRVTNITKSMSMDLCKVNVALATLEAISEAGQADRMDATALGESIEFVLNVLYEQISTIDDYVENIKTIVN